MVRFLERVFPPLVLSSGTTVTLHDRVSSDLGEKFSGMLVADSGESSADLVIRGRGGLAIVEVKTGDPDRSLPSSAAAQMRHLAENARRVYGAEAQIIPVLVTNYKTTDIDKEELDKYGIKLVQLAANLSAYDPEKLSSEFAAVVGLDAPSTLAEA
jgi:hypothetical protein